jgi:hypothetical protein
LLRAPIAAEIGGDLPGLLRISLLAPVSGQVVPLETWRCRGYAGWR